MKERRKFPREEIYNKALLNGEIIGYVRDISQGGMKVSVIKLDNVIMEGTIDVKIISAEVIGENISFQGIVKWSKEEGVFVSYGLEFKDFETDNEQLFLKYSDYIQNLDHKDSGVVIEIVEIEE